MLERISLLGCDIEIDREKTQNWYAQAGSWGCSCGDCLNFLELAKRNLLPGQVLDLLALLGIPPEKATYVCLLTKSQGNHLYQFSYRIAGNILRNNTESAAYGARFCHEPYPYGAPGFPEPHFDLEFYVELPWVADHS